MSNPLAMRPDIREGRFRFLSMGAGVQTTALLLMDTYDEVIMADTGSELPATYEYVRDYMLPYCQKEHIKFTMVRNKSGLSLEQYFRTKRDIPNFVFRNCTKEFKIQPIIEYLRAKKIVMPAISVTGISIDEVERIRTDHPPEWFYEYPLVDKSMRRRDCEGVIKRFGWPVPEKSGCYYCMFNTTKRMKHIKALWPELWEKAKDFEQQARNYPAAKLSISGMTLEEIDRKYLADGNSTLFQEGEAEVNQMCDSGHCMV